MINHDISPVVQIGYESGKGQTLTAVKDIKKGDPIHYAYNKMDVYDSYINYGFI